MYDWIKCEIILQFKLSYFELYYKEQGGDKRYRL